MKCIYYSTYPWADPEADAIEDTRPGYCGDVWVQPFRLYKAAVCTTNTEYASIEDFLNEIFEILDMPEYKGVEDIHKSFILEGIHVDPTEHLYGATNDGDGIYQVDDTYYIQDRYGHEYNSFKDWKEAVDYLSTHGHRRLWEYLGGIDYRKPE